MDKLAEKYGLAKDIDADVFSGAQQLRSLEKHARLQGDAEKSAALKQQLQEYISQFEDVYANVRPLVATSQQQSAQNHLGTLEDKSVLVIDDYVVSGATRDNAMDVLRTLNGSGTFAAILETPLNEGVVSPTVNIISPYEQTWREQLPWKTMQDLSGIQWDIDTHQGEFERRRDTSGYVLTPPQRDFYYADEVESIANDVVRSMLLDPEEHVGLVLEAREVLRDYGRKDLALEDTQHRINALRVREYRNLITENGATTITSLTSTLTRFHPVRTL